MKSINNNNNNKGFFIIKALFVCAGGIVYANCRDTEKQNFRILPGAIYLQIASLNCQSDLQRRALAKLSSISL